MPILKTRARLDALAAEVAALRAAAADRASRRAAEEEERSAFRAETRDAVAALRAEAAEALATVRGQLDELAGAGRAAAADLDRLRDQGERDRHLLAELRDGIDRLRDGLSDQDRSRQGLHMTVVKLERRMEQHADELHTATAALLARVEAIRRG